ncbi:hypothetical protein KDA_47910 [Dictyobacter alpinus]|uniref:Carrier domain-containing protein n=1 Tax=Dictyobacter alpinus TaxID=2014873 RepID=A0A402BDF8_9CHLR|nr:condensation domain-containing protein [Dictyobacter alpinus]GCE29307.1 hypothetical protein KDA_47910 [Dictyobacter alpinus]
MPNKEELEKRRSGLDVARQVLLEKRKQKIAAIAERIEIIPHHPADEPIPASFAQQRFWFIHQLKPDNTAHNEIRTLRTNTALDLAIVERALLEIMRRHEIMRTTFAFNDGQLQQIVRPYEETAADASIFVCDLTRTPEAEREQAAQEAILATIKRPFDLSQGLLWRTTLIKMGEMDTIFISVLHHSLCDGWGLDIFERELQTLYLAFQAGQPSPLSELPLQYADFSYWEQQRARGEIWARQRNYWRQTLENTSDQPLLYGDHPRQALQETSRASVSFTVPAPITRKLKDMSTQEGLTLFMLLLATFQILLFQYSEQEDIIVGTPISSRTRPELEPLIGCFINMLVLRTHFTDDPSIKEVLQRVRTTAVSAYANQDIPFEILVADLAPKRDKNRNPFFQVMLDFQNYQQASAEPSKASISARDLEADVSQFDLVMRLWDNGQELPGEIFYPAELFNATTVEDIKDHFLTLLARLTDDITSPLSALPSLSERERATIASWNTARLQEQTAQAALVAHEEDAFEDEETAPRTPLEEILVEIWKQVLGLETVGIHDNFFQIGGHSLLATQLLVQVQEVLNIDISLQLVFDSPTIATFSTELMKDENNKTTIERTIDLLLSVTDLSEEDVEDMLQNTAFAEVAE